MDSDLGTSALVGRRLGTYDVQARLGAGGMGEVYRARDTKLGRDVAIKILPRAFTSDPERLARFEREARMLATLNHPNIGSIYGLEDADGIPALILELIEGETLADRIARGPLALTDALPIAKQIAEALEAAHDKGIVHRDLKPRNVALTRDGIAKVLDFGLAKTTPSGPAADGSHAPTMTFGDTREGIVLGTASYMSPEQARGQAIDKRTDIWALGCVLYEMLTGQIAFRGDTISDTIASVLDHEPNWTTLPATTPTNIRRLLERCLAKHPKDRLRDVGDAHHELDDALTSLRTTPRQTLGAAPEAVRHWRLLAITATAILAVALGAFALTAITAWRSPRALDTSSYRFIPLSAEPADESSPSWSPDGRSVAYVAEVDGVRQVLSRSLDSAISTQITKSSTDSVAPFWSPDGTRIYFTSVSTSGGDLSSVGATGGDPELVMKDAGASAMAPDGKSLAFLRGRGGRRSLWIATIPDGEPQQYRIPPFPETFTRSDAVDYSRDGAKIAVLVERQEGPAFNSELWVIPYPSGIPRRVLTRARDASGGRISWLPDNRHVVMDSVFSDRLGSHLYLADTQTGTILPITLGTVEEQSPSVSPTGDRIAFAAGSDDFDLVNIPVDGSEIHTLLASARNETRPTWSPTGSQFAYVTNARGTPEIWARNVAEGWTRPIITREPEGSGGVNLYRPSFSPDGLRIVYEVIGSRHSVWVASVADGRGVPLDQESPDQHSPAWSPDGKWVAYQRLLGENWELVKVPSGGGRPVRLAEATPGGGDQTAWSPTGDWIAHVTRGALRLTSAADGQTQKALNGPPPLAFGFSLDGSLLYAVRHAANGIWELVEFDVRSTKDRKVTDLHLPPRATLTGFSLHPDGKSFATAIGIARHDIWLLEGFKQPSR